MVKLNYVLIKDNHISEILYSLSHKKNNQLIAVCPGQKSKQFYSMLNINSNYKNIKPLTIQEYLTKQTQSNSTVLILSAPTNFQTLQQILNRSQILKQNVILSLLQQNKKYLNIILKKVKNLQLSEMIYSPNKFVGINDKIRDFVDKSYDMNRAAFYAYGEFINYLRANLIKKIFRTQLINLDELARSYGFTSAQRIKQGTFLKSSAQKAKKAQKRKEKRLNKNKQQKSKKVQNQEDAKQEVRQEINTKIKKTKKISKLAGKKTKKNS